MLISQVSLQAAKSGWGGAEVQFARAPEWTRKCVHKCPSICTEVECFCGGRRCPRSCHTFLAELCRSCSFKKVLLPQKPRIFQFSLLNGFCFDHMQKITHPELPVKFGSLSDILSTGGVCRHYRGPSRFYWSRVLTQIWAFGDVAVERSPSTLPSSNLGKPSECYAGCHTDWEQSDRPPSPNFAPGTKYSYWFKPEVTCCQCNSGQSDKFVYSCRLWDSYLYDCNPALNNKVKTTTNWLFSCDVSPLQDPPRFYTSAEPIFGLFITLGCNFQMPKIALGWRKRMPSNILHVQIMEFRHLLCKGFFISWQTFLQIKVSQNWGSLSMEAWLQLWALQGPPVEVSVSPWLYHESTTKFPLSNLQTHTSSLKVYSRALNELITCLRPSQGQPPNASELGQLSWDMHLIWGVSGSSMDGLIGTLWPGENKCVYVGLEATNPGGDRTQTLISEAVGRGQILGLLVTDAAGLSSQTVRSPFFIPFSMSRMHKAK